ncbi:PIN domain-containing protein [Candidatus Poribacteria bacterium]|nr:PIN domain-containing protein [Candidatus Poribacteria bacterium]
MTLIDTSAFYALADKSDAHHADAKAFYEANCLQMKWVTTDYLLVESWLLINHRLGRRAAMAFWETIQRGIITLLEVQAQDLQRAWEIAAQYNDQDFSLVDCTTFALMERYSIQNVFCFDAHFTYYRFGMDRKKRFTTFP